MTIKHTLHIRITVTKLGVKFFVICILSDDFRYCNSIFKGTITNVKCFIMIIKILQNVNDIIAVINYILHYSNDSFGGVRCLIVIKNNAQNCAEIYL